MSFSKPQVSFSSNIASLYSVMRHNPLYFFGSKIIYFVQKKPIKVKIFETFECKGQNSSNSSCQVWNDKSINSSSNFALLCKFCTHAFSTSDKRIPSKSQFWVFQVLWLKFIILLISFSKPQVSFSSDFQILYTFSKRSLSKYKVVEMPQKLSKVWRVSWHWRVLQYLKKNWL